MMSSNPNPQNIESIKHGAKIYDQRCAVCHADNAKGLSSEEAFTNIAPSDLIAAAQKNSDSTFAARVAFGRGSKDMPQFREELTKQDIWDVTNYVYSLK